MRISARCSLLSYVDVPIVANSVAAMYSTKSTTVGFLFIAMLVIVQ